MSQWKRVPGFPMYEVNDIGEVRTLGQRPGVLRQYPNRAGYPSVALTRPDGRMTRRRVAVLVALAFIGEPRPGQLLRHLDDDRDNSALTNLAYGTYADNAQDRVRNGRDANARRTHCKHGHEFTPENTADYGRGRECRTCAREREARRRSERKARL